MALHKFTWLIEFRGNWVHSYLVHVGKGHCLIHQLKINSSNSRNCSCNSVQHLLNLCYTFFWTSTGFNLSGFPFWLQKLFPLCPQVRNCCTKEVQFLHAVFMLLFQPALPGQRTLYGASSLVMRSFTTDRNTITDQNTFVATIRYRGEKVILKNRKVQFDNFVECILCIAYFHGFVVKW